MQFQALRYARNKERAELVQVSLDQLTQGEVLIKVHWSAINYKDALAVTGSPGVVRVDELNTGIDLAGEVVESQSADFSKGDAVVVAGSGLSETLDGGFSEYARIPAAIVNPIPEGLQMHEAALIGTAGFTAALALHKLKMLGVSPDNGPCAITGATGGVGSFAIDIFSGQGFRCHALSRKQDQHEYLKSLGASETVNTSEINMNHKPLASAVYGSGVDSVGGELLDWVLRSSQVDAAIACVGLASNHRLSTSVMPLILRSASLVGVSAVTATAQTRQSVWQKLGNDWRPRHLERIKQQTITLSQVYDVCCAMLRGQTTGRTLVKVS